MDVAPVSDDVSMDAHVRHARVVVVFVVVVVVVVVVLVVVVVVFWRRSAAILSFRESKRSLCPHAVPPFARCRAETAALYAYVNAFTCRNCLRALCRARFHRDDGHSSGWVGKQHRARRTRVHAHARARARTAIVSVVHECGVKQNAT